MSQQSTNTVFMIRPRAFFSNTETVSTNEFQQSLKYSAGELQERACSQFDKAVAKLRDAGVGVIVVSDSAEPEKPDAIFPNNWFTTHCDGSVVLYPMQARSRRYERRPEIVDVLEQEHQFSVTRVLDLSGYEHNDQFLEGTGSLVLDRVNRFAFACISPRTNEIILQEFCRQLNYKPIVFEAHGPSGQPIYHTNVMMSIGTGYAIVCLDSVKTHRSALENALADHDVMELSPHQMKEFAGNALEVQTVAGNRLLVMSKRAQGSLSQHQLQAVSRHVKVVCCDVSIIEQASGGSIRCMMAEIFLPRIKKPSF